MRDDTTQTRLNPSTAEERLGRRRYARRSPQPLADAPVSFTPTIVDAAFEALSGPAWLDRETAIDSDDAPAHNSSSLSTDALLDNLRDQVRALDQQCGQLAQFLRRAQQ